MRTLLALLAFLPACFIDAPTYYVPDSGSGDDSPDAEFDPCPNAFVIGGDVDGLWDPSEMSLRLETDGKVDFVTVDANEAFAFAPCLDDGSTYTVAIETQPEQHTCTLFGASGTIAGSDVESVHAKCIGPIGVSIAVDLPIDWTFDPAKTVHHRDLSLLSQAFRATVTAPGADGIVVNGVAIASGVSSDLISLAAGVNTIALTVTSTSLSRTYVLEFDRGAAEVAQFGSLIKAQNMGAADRLGKSVALSHGVAVVGAEWEDSSGPPGLNDNAMDSGAVYLSRQTQSSPVFWNSGAFLKASDAAAFGSFGRSVAADGDTVVVGSSLGKVYVFRYDGTWTEEAIVTPANVEPNDYFGWSVALSGDVLVVGAVNEASNATGVNGDETDNSQPLTGAAYVFRRSGATWTQEAYLKPAHVVLDSTTNQYWFGSSVAVSGDTVAVGALDDDSGSIGVGGDSSDTSLMGSGAVYIFKKSADVWAQEAYVKASNPGQYDRFGETIALDNDVLVVGAEGEDSLETGINGNGTDNSLRDAGAAYIFRRTSSWAQEAYVKASNTGLDDAFGYTVAIRGDLVAIGAVLECSDAVGVNGDESNDDAQYSGAAYLFRWTGQWSQVAYVKPSNTGPNDQFGTSVSLTDHALLVGAPLEDSGPGPGDTVMDSGAAYMFR